MSLTSAACLFEMGSMASLDFILDPLCFPEQQVYGSRLKDLNLTTCIQFQGFMACRAECICRQPLDLF